VIFFRKKVEKKVGEIHCILTENIILEAIYNLTEGAADDSPPPLKQSSAITNGIEKSWVGCHFFWWYRFFFVPLE
jgi:hypothetical protein